jgi:C-terminal processing protease CtpA/Prc
MLWAHHAVDLYSHFLDNTSSIELSNAGIVSEPLGVESSWMKSRLFLYLALTVTAGAQSNIQWNLASMAGFEYGLPGAAPTAWSVSSDGAVVTDCTVAHSGNCSARVLRTASTNSQSSSLAFTPSVPSSGATLAWSGWVQTQGVNGYAMLYVGENDVNGNSLAYAHSTLVEGSTDWQYYSASIPLSGQGSLLYAGFLLSGTGTAWLDDVQLSVDGQPVIPIVPASFISDHQFDGGSGISLASLSDIQVQNLATLAKVWGFLKYYHPLVTSGQFNWDYELLRVLPTVLAAGDAPTANQAIAVWIAARLGTAAPCNPCATLDTGDLDLGADLAWLSDVSLLGSGLSQTLAAVYANRTPATQTFFVSLAPNVGNPLFQFESYYPNLGLPDSGYQLLALFRAWNMIEYFYPNRAIMPNHGEDPVSYWDSVLQQAIPEFAAARNSLAFEQAALRLTAMIHDTHSGITNMYSARPPIGNCELPVQVRFVEDQPVVTGYLSSDGASSGLQPGDVIQQLDGAAIAGLVAQWTPYYADSTGAAQLRDIGNAMTQGNCGPASVTVLRGEQQISLSPSRVPVGTLNFTSNGEDDLPGNTFQMLSSDIAYLKLSSVVAADSANYINSAAGTKGLIIDIRNYPSDFVPFTLGDLLVSSPVNFVQFTVGDVTNPGAFHWQIILGLTPAQPQYTGKVVILVNEITQSQAEYTAMALRASPNAIVVGSTTAGADGNISPVPLPGGFYFYFSGIGVFYPNHDPTQRVGIVPNIVARPTIAGIRAGRDQVLDEAIRLIEGQEHIPPDRTGQ